MIGYLKGHITEVDLESCIVDVRGVGGLPRPAGIGDRVSLKEHDIIGSNQRMGVCVLVIRPADVAGRQTG